MSHRRFHTIVLITALVVIGGSRPAALCAASWQDTYTAIAAEPGQARTAYEFLERQPLETKQTLAFHVVLARAARALENALTASRCVMIIDLFLRPKPAPDLSDVKQWLSQKGLKYHQQALSALGRGDERAAARAYLDAVRCDQAVLGFGDRHLRETSYSTMDRMVRAHSGDAGYWGHLAFYSYFFGHPDAARNALEHGIPLQKDPYMLWVYQEGLRAIERDGREVKPDKPAPPPAADAADPVVREYTNARAEQIKTELARVSNYLENPTATPPPSRFYEVSADATPETTCSIGDNIARYRVLKNQLSADLKTVLLRSAGFGVSY